MATDMEKEALFHRVTFSGISRRTQVVVVVIVTVGRNSDSRQFRITWNIEYIEYE